MRHDNAEHAAEWAQEAAGLRGGGNEILHLLAVVQHVFNGAGAGGGIRDAGADPAGGGGEARFEVARFGRALARETCARRARVRQGAGLEAGEEGAETLGQAVEAVGEQTPGFGGKGGRLVRRGNGREGLGAEPDQLRPTPLGSHIGAHGSAKPAEDGGEVGCNVIHELNIC